nr:NADH dehydrogenase subunit 2 [Scatoglyphus polytrematus]
MLMILVMTTLYAISSSNWISMWVCLEVNTLMMCFMMSQESKTKKCSQKQSLLYIIVQMMISVLLLLCISINQLMKPMMFSMMITILLMAKMGSWPFHKWYLKLIMSMSLNNISMPLLMTWQKIIPCILVTMSLTNNNQSTIYITITMVIMNMIIPVIMLKTLTSIKSLLALSSLNNNGWLFLSTMVSIKTFSLFLIFYSVSLYMVMNYLPLSNKKVDMIKTPLWVTSTLLMNISGLPPFSMFWMKLLVMKTIMLNNFPTEMIMVMMLTACIFMYNYMWNFLNQCMNMPMKTQMSTKSNYTLPMITTPLISTISILTIL